MIVTDKLCFMGRLYDDVLSREVKENMDIRVKIILSAALAAILAMTVLPPVTSMSYDHSDGITKVSPAISYEFLFAPSCMAINYYRLSLQYLIVFSASALLFLCLGKRPASFTTRLAELGVTNDKLEQYILKSKYTEQQLRQQTAELTATKEKLCRQIDEIRDAEKKSHTYSDQLERRVAQQTADLASLNKGLQDAVNRYKQTEEKLTAANEQLQREIAGRRQLEESFQRKIVELTSKIQQEAIKCKALEEQLQEQRQRYNQLFQEHSAQANEYNERLQEKMDESGAWAESEEELDESRIPSELFDVEKMKALAELAKRLSRKK
jgi:phage shock protein A